MKVNINSNFFQTYLFVFVIIFLYFSMFLKLKSTVNQNILKYNDISICFCKNLQDLKL